MKYGLGGKVYLNHKSILSFILGHSKNNDSVFGTFYIDYLEHPNAKLNFHSDRGYQYTRLNDWHTKIFVFPLSTSQWHIQNKGLRLFHFKFKIFFIIDLGQIFIKEIMLECIHKVKIKKPGKYFLK